jgi:hypothetical protein
VAACRRTPELLHRIETSMLSSSLRILLKITIASLIVGTILSHFGITADHIMREAGLSRDRVLDWLERGWTWALPNLFLGSLIIVPMWFVFYLFRPPGARSD